MIIIFIPTSPLFRNCSFGIRGQRLVGMVELYLAVFSLFASPHSEKFSLQFVESGFQMTLEKPKPKQSL